MRRIEVVLSIAVLVSVALVISLLLVIRTTGMPNVVACLETENPAMSVEVRSNRAGAIVERDVLGCSVYWYAGRGGG
jgi:hypothetical protein